MGRLLKVIVLVLATLGVFYVFNTGSAQFLKWYASLQLLPQLVAGFAVGGVCWLLGRAVNLLFLQWSNQQFSTVLPGLVLLVACWMFHSLVLFSDLKGSLNTLSWASVSTVILAAELSVYPLLAAFYQSREFNKGEGELVCPSEPAFAEVRTTR